MQFATPLLGDLAARGLIADVAKADELDAHLGQARRTLYIGFDPTADSLHVGSLLPLLVLRRVQIHGHRPIVLIGGGTGLIGDPSGKTGERALNPKEQVAVWADRLKRQVERFLDFTPGPTGAVLDDNYTWLSELQLIEFLRSIGKHFALGPMLGREAVRSRMERSDEGISYTEFSYQILQAYDFLELYRRHGCTLQAGGSDQWGNITAGMRLIRQLEQAEAFGFTVPLVMKSDGTKFGKTEAGTVWLDPAKTSPYEMYQFWLNMADAEVVTYLKYFTFLPREAIDALAQATAQAPERREAQRALAREVTTLVHGAAAAAEAEAISAAFFSGSVEALSAGQLAQACAAMPCSTVGRGALAGLGLVDLLVKAGLAESKKRARELIAAGAVHVNGRRVERADARATAEGLLHGRFLVLRKGKRTYHAVTLA
ncbi:MAG: tyrosine--tRNA ligase [Candidatus Rokubacteria bacterium]|nr:tyrosine--tRNA ligase [Candidatus Rokubacteria bacterium]MBI3824653.1 tyrosine--tRNA ligase [Candidatus Rokubacteria bacterium]